MMDAWHLLWIIPVAASCGLLVGCCRAAGDADKRKEKHHESE